MLRIRGLLIAEVPQVNHVRPDAVTLSQPLTFAQIALAGFQPIRVIIFIIFLYVYNFFLDRPFGFSLHRDAHF